MPDIQPPAPPSAKSLHAAISDATVRILADYTGRGATKARTTISGDWVFITLMDTLTKGERRLVESSHGEFVLQSRKAYQHAMREEFTREIENLTGRKVIAFMSDNHINPDVGIEVLLLEPVAEPNGR